jgi:peptide/nickel transport system substrate-binding protein
MPTTQRVFLPLLLVLLAGLALAACAGPSEAATPAAPVGDQTVTLPSAPGTLPTLTVCLGSAPNAIHPYLSPNIWSRMYLEGIYPSAYHVTENRIQPGLLAGLPSLADGTASIEQVPVEMGQMVLTADGTPQPLDVGLYIRPAGCHSAACAVLFNPNEPALMDQMTVRFQITPGLTWADGEPLTADDSVFAFEYNARNFATAGNTRPAFTASYTALDDTTVAWTGIPGTLPRSYMTYFWTPLPRHLWEGKEVVTSGGAQLALVVPASYGPYQLETWDTDTFMLYPNPGYSGPNPQGRFAPLVFQVVGNDGPQNVARLLSGECDVLDASSLRGVQPETLMELQAQGKANLLTSNAGAWELLYFGIVPAEYDDGYNPATDRPDYFGDVRVRRGLAMCLDRAALLKIAAAGAGEVMDTYVQANDPLASPEAASYPYDPQAGMALLEEAGWAAGSGGERTAQGVANVPDGTRLALRYFVAQNPINEAIAARLAANLEACGVDVELSPLPREDYYATGEGTPLFGRDFDLAQYSWSVDTSLEPACHLFLGDSIPGAEGEAHSLGWAGWNVTGWQNAEFDDSCQTARAALPGQAAHAPLHQSAQTLFADELPAIPLFTYAQFALTRPDLCGLQMEDLTGLLFGWDEARLCAP